MFSGCPSVRPKPEIPSFDLYMGPLVHQTNRDRYMACPYQHSRNFWNFLFLLIIPITQASRCTTG